MFETLEEQGDDISRYLDVRPNLKGIPISEEVFDVDVSADLRANFSRDSKNNRIHDVEFGFSPDLTPRVESPGSANLPEEVLQKLTEEFLSPYRRAFDMYPGTVDGFLAVPELLVRYGGCPSVVTTMVNRDSETLDIRKFREILKQVTLFDHSLNVARMMLKHLKKTLCGRDYESLIPEAFVVSFGHDLGKIPSLRANPLYPDPDQGNETGPGVLQEDL